jgi:threonine/homoserine/homoserine lactone efflux protein
MPPLDRLLSFAAVSFVLIVIPGPSVLFVVGRALAHGRRTAIATVVGNAVGVYAVAACVAFGVGTIVQRSATVFTIVKLAGAFYLIWLGINAIRSRHSMSTVFERTEAPRSDWRTIWEGFVVGVANPKVFILFAAVLPQFVDRSSGHLPIQMLVLSLVSFVIALVSDSAWGLAASGVRSWFARSPRRLGMVGGAGGAAMIGVGLNLAVMGRQD